MGGGGLWVWFQFWCFSEWMFEMEGFGDFCGLAQQDMAGLWVECCCIVFPIQLGCESLYGTIVFFYLCSLVSEKSREKEHTTILSIICNKEKTKQKRKTVSQLSVFGDWGEFLGFVE